MNCKKTAHYKIQFIPSALEHVTHVEARPKDCRVIRKETSKNHLCQPDCRKKSLKLKSTSQKRSNLQSFPGATQITNANVSDIMTPTYC